MNRTDAEAECRRLSEEHPERASHQWFPQDEGNGSWVVAKVALPPGAHIDPLKTAVESKPKPPQPDDPRTSVEQNVGGNYA